MSKSCRQSWRCPCGPRGSAVGSRPHWSDRFWGIGVAALPSSVSHCHGLLHWVSWATRILMTRGGIGAHEQVRLVVAVQKKDILAARGGGEEGAEPAVVIEQSRCRCSLLSRLESRRGDSVSGGSDVAQTPGPSDLSSESQILDFSHTLFEDGRNDGEGGHLTGAGEATDRGGRHGRRRSSHYPSPPR